MNFQSTLLRTPALFLVSVLVFSSCHKSETSNGGNPVNNSYLASARSFAPGYLTVDSFIYDASHNVAKFVQYQVDSANSRTDTIYTNFTYSGSSTLPTGYTTTYSSGIPDPHQLTFDGQGRIMKDTSLNGYGFVTYFTYPGNYIISETLYQGAVTDASVDTLTVSNGDVTGEKVWGTNQGSWEKQIDFSFVRASAANPGYKDHIASTIGPLLYVLDSYNYSAYGDYTSRTVISKLSGTAWGIPGSITYNASLDGSGRVSAITPTGIGVPAGTTTMFTYY